MSGALRKEESDLSGFKNFIDGVLSADLSSEGRTAENTAGTTGQPEEITMPTINFKPKGVEVDTEEEAEDQESLISTLKGFYNASRTQVAKKLAFVL